MSALAQTSPASPPSRGSRPPLPLTERPLGAASPWPIPLAAALALLMVGERARGLFEAARPLREFTDRAIGESTLAGVDASGYASTYVSTLLLGGLVFVGLLGALGWLDRRLRRPTPHRRSLELPAAFDLALFGAFAQLLWIVGRGRWQTGSLARILVTLACATVVWHVLLQVIDRRKELSGASSTVWRQLVISSRQPGVTAVALLLPACLFVAAALALGRPLTVPIRSPTVGTAVYVLVTAVILIGVAGWRHRAGDPTRAGRFDSGHRFLVVALPLLVIPLAPVLGNELQYTWAVAGPRTYALVLISTLAAAAAGAWWASRGGRFSRLAARVSVLANPRSMRRSIVFPLAIIDGATLVFHRHTLEIPELDYFHLGERTLPTQQLLHFGKIPLVDLRLTHTLSDIVYQSLYSAFNGVRGLDMLIWERWLALIVASVLIYFFLARIARPRFALLLTASAPVLSLVSSYYAPLLATPLVWSWATRRPTFARYTAVWLVLATTTAWRIDFGVASAAGLATAMAFDLVGRERRSWRAPIVSAVTLAALGAAIAVSVSLLVGRSIPAAALALLESYSQRLLTRTRPEIIESYGALAALQYVLLPVVGLIYVAALGWVRLVLRRPLETRHRLLGALAATCLVLSVRSTERHTLIEAFNPYLFFFLVVLLPFLPRRHIMRTLAYASALTLLLVRLTLVLPPLGFELGFFERSHLLPERELFELRGWSGDEQRVRFPDTRHRELIEFLEERLGPSQTFFDLTSSPLLYVLADRPFPTYLIPNLSQTSERVQARVLGDLEQWRERGELPYVLLHQNSYWDVMDGVPSEVRSYRIAEWIYRHYRPLGLLGTWEIWADGSVSPPSERRPLERVELAIHQPQEAHDVEISAGPTGVLRLTAGSADPFVDRFVELDASPILEAPNDWRLEIEIESASSGFVQLFYALDGAPYADRHAPFLSLDESIGGVLELDLPETGGRLTGLRIDPPDGARLEIRSVRLVRLPVTPGPLPGDRVEQLFELRRLPWVWANLDPHNALETTRADAVLVDRPTGVSDSEPLDLELPEAVVGKPPATYLRLLVKRPPSKRPTLSQPKVTILLDGDPCCGVTFELGQSRSGSRILDHLVRLATLYRWHVGGTRSLRVLSSTPIEVLRVELRSGD